MEQIDVGEYIRTDKGVITRYSDKEKTFLKRMNEGKSIFGKTIKHSKNIIDLIEVGDYVNGKEVHKYNGNTGIVSINELGWTFIAFKDKKYPIETIVTREQFASMEYKVED